MRNTFALRVDAGHATWGGDGFETIATYPTKILLDRDAERLAVAGFGIETWDNESERLLDRADGERTWTGSREDWALIDA